MNRCGAFGFAVVSSMWVVASARAAGSPAQMCAGAKLNATGKAAAAMLGCHATATRHGRGVRSACVAKARTKLTSRFAGSDGRGGCATTRDASRIAGILDSSVGAFVTALRPTTAANRCAAMKLKATGNKAKAKLLCYGKAMRGGGSVAADCLAKAEAHFASAFAAAEHSPTCLTTRDADDVESTVDDLVAEVVAAIPSEPPTTTPSSTTTVTTGTTTTTTTCLADGTYGCHRGGQCCEPDLCEATIYLGSAQASFCASCVHDFDTGGNLTGGCVEDADCCTAGHKCFHCGGFAGLCAPAGPDGCALAGFPCCPPEFGPPTTCCSTGAACETGACP